MSGMFGIGGGTVRIPLLNTHQAIATSLFVTVFTAIAAITIYWHRGNIIWLPALFVLIVSMIGARFGSKVSLKTKPLWLEIGLTVLIIILAFGVIYKALYLT